MARTAIISVDGHVKAPRSGYREYVEGKYLDAFDDWLRAAEARGLPDAGSIQSRLDLGVQWEPHRRLRDLETQGVVAEVLFPNGVPFQVDSLDDAGRAADPELTRAGMAAYNRWLADFCAQAPERLRGQALVLFDDVEQAVKDVRWAKEHGLGGIMMPGLYPGGTYFFDPALDPIWAAVQEAGLPVSQHGGAGAPVYSPPGLAAILTLAYEHAFFSGRSLWQMIVGGVFDRFPGLKVAFTETEVWWIGPALQRFDRRVKLGDDWTEFAAHLQRARAFSRLPSEYWATNCYAGISPFGSHQLSFARLGSGYEYPPGELAIIRSDRTMIGIDYPHFESTYPSTMDQVADLLGEPTVTEDDARRMLFDTAAEVYGLDRALLHPHIERMGFDLGDVRASTPA